MTYSIKVLDSVAGIIILPEPSFILLRVEFALLVILDLIHLVDIIADRVHLVPRPLDEFCNFRCKHFDSELMMIEVGKEMPLNAYLPPALRPPIYRQKAEAKLFR